ncbi:MAG: response regulator [Chthoniobacterales bacterium]
MRVLIADDHKGVGVTLAALVESCGHEVVQVVSSGLDAIQAYTRLKPDVVLMDFSMPHLNGATATRMIRSKDPSAKIVMITGSVATAKQADLGGITILAKPVDLDKLYGALYDAVRPASEAGQTTT